MGEKTLNEARAKARLGSILGAVACMLCMFSCCTNYITLFLALPLAFLAIHQSRIARSLAGDDEFVDTISWYGLVLGVLASLFSLMLLTVVALFLAFYLGFFVLLFLGILV